VYRGGQQHEAETLSSCYRESVRIAGDNGIRSLAFPSISTGAFGYPVNEAADIAVRTIIEALPPCVDVEHVRFVLFDIATCKAYVRAAEKLSRESLPTPVFEKGPS
jgi:O-acetyl-ADP-ribose deacetylase (regulator of RNase III)